MARLTAGRTTGLAPNCAYVTGPLGGESNARNAVSNGRAVRSATVTPLDAGSLLLAAAWVGTDDVPGVAASLPAVLADSEVNVVRRPRALVGSDNCDAKVGALVLVVPTAKGRVVVLGTVDTADKHL